MSFHPFLQWWRWATNCNFFRRIRDSKRVRSSAKVTYKLLGTDGFGWAGIWRCICSGSDCMHGPPGGDDKDFFDCLSKGCNISLKDDSITCVSTGCNQCALLIGINHPLPIVTQ